MISFCCMLRIKKKFIVSKGQFQISPFLNLNLEIENRINFLGLAKFYIYENIKYFLKKTPLSKKKLEPREIRFLLKK